MQRLLLGLFGALGATAAMAADMPVKAPPPVAAAYTWTGFYLGGHLGWGFEHHTTTNVGTVNSTNFPAGTSNSGDIDGFLGGVQAGFDWQFHPNWLIGAAGDFSWTDIHGDQSDPSTVAPAFVNHPHHEYKWLSTATGRIGYVANEWLIYAKGGAAWGKADSNSFTTNGVGKVVTTTESSTTRTGWTVGAGTEYRFAKNWSALLEYDYIDFGTATISNTVTLGSTAPVVTGATVLRDNRAYIHVVKAGINYRF